MKGFYYLIEEYGEEHILNEDEHEEIADLLSQAVLKFVMADLKLKNHNFNAMWSGETIETEGLKNKIKKSMDELKPFDIASHINYFFSSEFAMKNYYTYSVNVPGVNILYQKGTSKDGQDTSIYRRLTDVQSYMSFSGFELVRPIGRDYTRTRIRLYYKLIRDEIKQFMKRVKVTVQGQKEVGLIEDVDILVHGNVVMETLTENGITFDVEKSGDLPKDINERKTMIDNMIVDLEKLKQDGDIVDYTINEGSSKTIIKTFSKKLEDFNKEYSVEDIDSSRLNDPIEDAEEDNDTE